MSLDATTPCSVDSTVEHKRTGRLATARTTSPSGAVVDLLFASSGIEPEVVAAGAICRMEHAILEDFEVVLVA
jgi:hypothetical protein